MKKGTYIGGSIKQNPKPREGKLRNNSVLTA
jgi:hypothetical protein